MKFDICVGNPPYGERPSGISATLHLQIMKTVLDFCTDKLCFIMPSKPIIQQLDKDGVWYKMFMNAVCTDVEVVKKGTFKNTTMDDTAIYYIARPRKTQDALLRSRQEPLPLKQYSNPYRKRRLCQDPNPLRKYIFYPASDIQNEYGLFPDV